MNDENREMNKSPHVFISFNSADRKAVDALLSQLPLHIGLNDEESSDQEGRVLTSDNGRDFIIIDGLDQLDVAINYTHRYGERVLNLILSKEELETLEGDLAEEYAEVEAEHGRRIATAWYQKQVISSLLPLLWGKVCRKLQEWTVRWFHRPSL